MSVVVSKLLFLFKPKMRISLVMKNITPLYQKETEITTRNNCRDKGKEEETVSFQNDLSSFFILLLLFLRDENSLHLLLLTIPIV